MKKNIIPAVLLTIMIACNPKHADKDAMIDKKVDSVLSKMTLEEKIGQMNQYSVQWNPTGPVSIRKNDLDDIKHGKVGSMLNCTGIEYATRYQKMAVDSSRLHIPMIFGYDVIHGYKTTFPIPLATACSWDMELIEKGERVSATEAAADGVNWTFAPMVDIAHDARWGRVIEGAGEDPFLGSQIAAARVRGFQGKDLADTNSIVACIKHFAAYGAPEGGRDYNTVDMSERMLREIYLPPYKAAVDAGAGTVMSSFNEISGIPTTSDKWLLTDLLKKEWGFKGFVVSDWGSVGEIINHGVAENREEAAMLSANAGLDMEMESGTYRDYLAILVKSGKVSEHVIDDAVRRILRIKFKLGLFDNPYRFMNPERKKKIIFCKEHLEVARDAARKSIVLLKNDKSLLPLSKKIKSIVVIGPLGESARDMLGNWEASGDPSRVITLVAGLQNNLGNKVKIKYIKGCDVKGNNKAEFPQAIAAARKADVVLLAMGEKASMSGENQSRAFLNIPGVQEDLMKKIVETGKPVVLLLFNGRPLTINWEKENIPAILECWFPGIEAGNAIADVLFGDYNPSAKLVITFPYTVGQVPIYYNHKNSGKPYIKGFQWGSRYNDVTNEPLYCFGYGLSYTHFDYSGITLRDTVISMKDTLQVSVEIKNTGHYEGEEIAQLYIRDLVASVTRPVKELKGFQKIMLKPGESKHVKFAVTENDLRFWNKDMKFVAEPGKFQVFVGTNSQNVKESEFWLK